MKKLSTLIITFFIALNLNSQSLPSENGFGIQLGDPTAITGKFWLDGTDAIQANIGSGTFAGLRFTVDYVRHFNSFNSKLFFLYAGLGGVLGTGEGSDIIVKQDHDRWFYRDDGIGLAGRGLVGLQFIPRNTPLEIYLELGVLVGLTPAFGALSESALGVRFYF